LFKLIALLVMGAVIGAGFLVLSRRTPLGPARGEGPEA